MIVSPTERERHLVASFLKSFIWPCRHPIDLREERTGDLRCSRCDLAVARKSESFGNRSLDRISNDSGLRDVTGATGITEQAR